MIKHIVKFACYRFTGGLTVLIGFYDGRFSHGQMPLDLAANRSSRLADAPSYIFKARSVIKTLLNLKPRVKRQMLLFFNFNDSLLSEK
jgi:hypothetical protein